MVIADDFDRKMLLLATNLAHELDLKNVLLASLEALLRSTETHGPTDSDTEAILLLRCIIRLVMRLVKEAVTDQERCVLVVETPRSNLATFPWQRKACGDPYKTF